MIELLEIAGTIVSVVGLGVAGWSLVQAIRKYRGDA